MAWIERLLTSLGDLIKLLKKNLKKKHLVALGQGYNSALGVLKSSCLRPPFPRPGKGGWVVLTGSRIIFAMKIYSIRVSNHTSLALGREGSHVGAACVQDCFMQWKYFRNLTIPCQSGPTSTHRIPEGIGWLTYYRF